MTHKEFVEAYNRGSIKVHITRGLISNLSLLLPKRMKLILAFWMAVFCISFPVAIVCFVWVKWWVGLAIFIFGLRISRVSTKTASKFYLKHALTDDFFYDNALKNGYFQIEKNIKE